MLWKIIYPPSSEYNRMMQITFGAVLSYVMESKPSWLLNDCFQEPGQSLKNNLDANERFHAQPEDFLNHWTVKKARSRNQLPDRRGMNWPHFMMQHDGNDIFRSCSNVKETK